MNGSVNEILEKILTEYRVKSARTLLFEVENNPVAYITEYIMDTPTGNFTFWIVFKHEECDDRNLLEKAGIVKYPARAMNHFPAFLDKRVPPPYRVDIEDILSNLGLEEYNKFDILINSESSGLVYAGKVVEVACKTCEEPFIKWIDRVLEDVAVTID